MKEFFFFFPLIAVSILVILSFPLSSPSQEAPGTSLTKLQNTFLAKKTELDAARLEKRAELLKRYGDVLTRIKQNYQTAGKLNETVLVTKEWDAAQKGELQTWPATATPPPDLGNARKVAQAELEKIDRQHGNDLAELGGRYLKALEGLKTTLTQAGKIDEGLAVVKEIENLNTLLERLSEGRGTAGFKRDLPPALRKDLVVYFSFDEKDGNVLSSSIEMPIKGILEGTKFVPVGKVGGARYFSGNRDRVALSSPLPDSKEMTIALWMKFQGDLKTGGLFADYDEKNANDMTRMMKNRFDVVLTEFKQRGREDYYEELPLILEWMRLHRRAPLPSVLEMKTLRPSDNRFYWLEIGGLPEQIMKPRTNRQGDPLPPRPLPLTAKVTAGNTLYLTVGAERISLWLSPEFVSFEEKLKVQWKGRTMFNQIPERDIGVMLEHLRITGDRERLYWMNLNF